MNAGSDEAQPVGYSKLIAKHNLKVIPHFRMSFITLTGRGSQKTQPLKEIVLFPKTYLIQDPNSSLQHLEFAIKHEGINLEIINELFAKLSPKNISKFIKEKPTGKYRRIIWFLYEYLTDKQLNIENIKNTPYIDLLDQKKYYTAEPVKSKRHAINNNLLGNRTFCPFIRRTECLETFRKKNLSLKAKKLTASIEPHILARATNFLYIKETKSSFGIEKVNPDIKRTARFISLLEEAHLINHLNKELLLNLQNTIVESRYKDNDYRETQNYVGELTSFYIQKIHYISPKPEDLASLMEGFLKCEEKLFSTKIHPVLIASILAFAFVFIHPFEDGNGRIHRFIIHYVLSRTKFTPDNAIFPVSAVMLKNIKQYDETLETFSKPLMQIISNYTLNDEGEMHVRDKTAGHYCYIDYTHFAEYIFSCIETTIREDFPEELDFIVQYDKTKTSIQDVIDMPDMKIDRIIRCIAQNKGVLGEKMKKTLFNELDDKTIQAIEQIVQKNMLE